MCLTQLWCNGQGFHTSRLFSRGVFPLLKVLSVSPKTQVSNGHLWYCARQWLNEKSRTLKAYTAIELPHGKQAPHKSFRGAAMVHITWAPNPERPPCGNDTEAQPWKPSKTGLENSEMMGTPGKGNNCNRKEKESRDFKEKTHRGS